LASDAPATVAAALVALDQMPSASVAGDKGVAASDVVPHLNAEDQTLRDAARWIVARHPEWGGELSAWLREQLATVKASADEAPDELANLLAAFAGNATLQEVLAAALVEPQFSSAARRQSLDAVAAARLGSASPALLAALAGAVLSDDAELAAAAEAAIGRVVDPETRIVTVPGAAPAPAWYERPWVWGVAGAVVATAVLLPFVLDAGPADTFDVEVPLP
jgi:hypothetical protein